MNWQTPKTITYNDGAIIIEIDDGMMGSYSHWFPLCRRLARKYSQWRFFNPVVCCPAINTASIDTSNTYMKSVQLQKLYANGWEMLSHGKNHVGLGEHSITSEATLGQSTIYVNNASYLSGSVGYTFRIWEGETEENIILNTVNRDDNYITVTQPLQNTYSTSAKMSMAESSLVTALQGCIDDLSAWGIPCNNHVYAYHAGSQYLYNEAAVTKVRALFDSARGYSGDYNTSTTDNHLMKSRLINDTLTEATVDTILNNTASNDYVTIFYGHGEVSVEVLSILEYIIEGALNRGIRILTRSKALERLL